MTIKTPLFWMVLGGVLYLHHFNGEAAKKAEELAEHEKELTRLAAERRRTAPLSSAERLEAVTLKKQQVGVWENKLAAAEKNAKADSSASARVRVDHAKERLGQIRAKLAELEASSEHSNRSVMEVSGVAPALK